MISDVTLSQDGCEERDDGLVMIASGASVNVSQVSGKSKLQQSDGATCLIGANGKPLQECGKRQIWLRICGQTKRPCGERDEADLECDLVMDTSH